MDRWVVLEQVRVGLGEGFPAEVPAGCPLLVVVQLCPVPQALRLAANTTATARTVGMRFMPDLLLNTTKSASLSAGPVGV